MRHRRRRCNALQSRSSWPLARPTVAGPTRMADEHPLAWHASVAARHRLCRVSRAATGCAVVVCDPTRPHDAPHAARRARRPAEGRPSQGQPSAALYTGNVVPQFGTIRCGRPPVRQPPASRPRRASAQRESERESRAGRGSRTERARVKVFSRSRHVKPWERIAHVPHLQESVEPLAEFAGRRPHHTRARGGRETTDALDAAVARGTDKRAHLVLSMHEHPS